MRIRPIKSEKKLRVFDGNIDTHVVLQLQIYQLVFDRTVLLHAYLCISSPGVSERARTRTQVHVICQRCVDFNVSRKCDRIFSGSIINIKTMKIIFNSRYIIEFKKQWKIWNLLLIYTHKSCSFWKLLI